MPPTDAVALENWFPLTSYVEIRGGYEDQATGMAEAGKTLAVYNGFTSSKMFCLTNSHVYDVSVAGAVGGSVASVTNGKFQWVNFGDGSNNYLILANGQDKVLYYNGSAWVAVDSGTSPALTGIATTSLVYPFVSKGRLYFIEIDSLSFWYLAAGAAGGALTEFDLSSVAKKGGYLVAGATWTVDGGDGPDDRVVFVTSEGEVIVYAGTNPSSAASWALVGVYDLGKPIGRRCLTKFGGDLILITQNGAFPLAAALQSASIDYKVALSFKIETAFTQAARTYGTVFGWEPIIYPAHSALIVNVPHAEGGTHEQFVMNTETKAWCKFNSWDAEDFAVFNSDLYFCSGTSVLKAWTGTIDGVNNIVAYGKTAFSYFGRAGLEKEFSLFRPVLSTTGPINFLTDIDVDFREQEMTGTAIYSTISGALWDVGLWDVGFWAATSEVVKQWTSPTSYPGYCAAGKIKIATNALTIQWMSNDFVYSYGAIL